jgi:hypothetical protein
MAPILSRVGFDKGFGRRKGASSVAAAFATGGDLRSAYLAPDGYYYHTFSTPGTFTVISGPKNVELLVVGGGGGSTGSGGGAGGGGIVYVPSFPVSSPISVNVGSGGLVAAVPANDGNPSSFGPTVIATGGGGGFTDGTGFGPGRNGGSGSGGLGPGRSGGSSVSPPSTGGGTTYGNPGGSGYDRASGGGGGGAGAAGSSSGPGGNGQPFPQFSYSDVFPSPIASTLNPHSPTSNHYGGGGGGGQSESGTIFPGGFGGGGQSAAFDASPGNAGVGVNYLGGGGGGSSTRSGVGTKSGAAGGSGIVIIRYLP